MKDGNVSIDSLDTLKIGSLLFGGGRGHLIQVFTGGRGFDSSGEFRRCGIGGLWIFRWKQRKIHDRFKKSKEWFLVTKISKFWLYLFMWISWSPVFKGVRFFLALFYLYGIYFQNRFLSFGAMAVIVVTWLSLRRKVRVCYRRASVVQLPFKTSLGFQEKLLWDVRM